MLLDGPQTYLKERQKKAGIFLKFFSSLMLIKNILLVDSAVWQYLNVAQITKNPIINSH